MNKIPLFIALASFTAFSAPTPDAKAIFARSMDVERAPQWSAISLIIIKSGGKEKAKMGKVFNKLDATGRTSKRMYRFFKPVDIDGVSFLTHERKAAPNDIWIFLPSLAKTRRILSGNRKDAFLGSEFSYANLSALDEDSFRHTSDPDTVIGTTRFHVVKSVIADPALANDVGFFSQTSLVRAADSSVFLIRYSGKDGSLLKTQRIENFIPSPVPGKSVPAKRTMLNHKNKNESVLVLDKIDFKTPLSEKDFLESGLNG